MSEATLTITPMILNNKLSRDDGKLLENAQEFRSMVKALSYVCHTISDIIYSVSKVAQFMHEPPECHLLATKRILQYMSRTAEYGLGHCVLVGDNMVSWNEQKVVLRSTIEEEYSSLVDAAPEVAWVDACLTDLGVVWHEKPIIWRDNTNINEEASEKVLEVEQKYNEIRKPIYDKRNEKIKDFPLKSVSMLRRRISVDLFFYVQFLSHPALGELLNDEDQKIFKYISSLEVEDFKDLKSGYSITFNFDPNPYFEDANLTKTFTFLDEGTKITATKIKWKEGMDLPNGVDHEKKGNKRQFAEESFFTWFSDAQQKDDMDEIHDEVAEIIKDDLWPNPLTYFNNDADEEDFEDDEELHHLLPSFFFQLLNS
ncbi:NAP1-related protein 2-like [Hibiscus syriacus]|uniref:NAP1-related protein 2-like n=1 Tax=Hibiscus syriacus TaxID=106335 RepID=UPI0019246CA0|nr:NAP1-related protein 2-like [Hibiscus syriacus]